MFIVLVANERDSFLTASRTLITESNAEHASPYAPCPNGVKSDYLLGTHHSPLFISVTTQPWFIIRQFI